MSAEIKPQNNVESPPPQPEPIPFDILTLPDELLINILRYMPDHHSFLKLSTVNRRFDSLIRDPIVRSSFANTWFDTNCHDGSRLAFVKFVVMYLEGENMLRDVLRMDLGEKVGNPWGEFADDDSEEEGEDGQAAEEGVQQATLPEGDVAEQILLPEGGVTQQPQLLDGDTGEDEQEAEEAAQQTIVPEGDAAEQILLPEGEVIQQPQLLEGDTGEEALEAEHAPEAEVETSGTATLSEGAAAEQTPEPEGVAAEEGEDAPEAGGGAGETISAQGGDVGGVVPAPNGDAGGEVPVTEGNNSVAPLAFSMFVCVQPSEGSPNAEDDGNEDSSDDESPLSEEDKAFARSAHLDDVVLAHKLQAFLETATVPWLIKDSRLPCGHVLCARRVPWSGGKCWCDRYPFFWRWITSSRRALEQRKAGLTRAMGLQVDRSAKLSSLRLKAIVVDESRLDEIFREHNERVDELIALGKLPGPE